MNKKQTAIILSAFFILLFVLLPVAANNDYVTYGDVKSSFNAFLSGKERKLSDGRIVPWLDGITYRYEDAHGIYQAIYVTESGLELAQFLMYYYFGVIFTYDNINEGCKEYLSWFTVTSTLNGEPLEMVYTPIKRSQCVDSYGDPILWWFSVGTLFKTGELEPGTYHLVTYYWMYLLGFGIIPNPITPTEDIWFTIE
jgi:hypothetical protein